MIARADAFMVVLLAYQDARLCPLGRDDGEASDRLYDKAHALALAFIQKHAGTHQAAWLVRFTEAEATPSWFDLLDAIIERGEAPVCFGTDDCSTMMLAVCRWREDCGG